jgi:PTH1 family peptidyl-tRNA hydrolase
MKLIIGLGNPGKNHAFTRHNAGFLFLDFLQKEWEFDSFQENKKMSAEISEGQRGKEKVLLVKPSTFMNASGTTVSQLVHFYKLTPSDIVVLHDDLDITPGTYKKTLSSRAAGHNGVSDIIDKLDTQDFLRFRIGIGRPVEVNGVCMPSHDFVLQNFSAEEQERLFALFPEIQKDLEASLSL